MMLSCYLIWCHQRLRRDVIIVLEPRKASICPHSVMPQKDLRRQRKSRSQERFSSYFSDWIQIMANWSTSSAMSTTNLLSHGSLSALNVIPIIICIAMDSLTLNGRFWTAQTTLAKNRLNSLTMVSNPKWMSKWDWHLKNTWQPTVSSLVWWPEH